MEIIVIIVFWGIVFYLFKKFISLFSPKKKEDSGLFISNTLVDGIDPLAWRAKYSDDYINKKQREMAYIRNNKSNLPVPSIFNNYNNWELKLVLSNSRSVSFADCLSIIKELKTYTEYIEDNIQKYEAVFFKEQLPLFKKVYDLVKNLKGTRVYINGDLMDKNSLARILRCAVDKANSLNKNFCYGASFYTANPLGCHRIFVRFDDNDGWFRYSFLKNGRVFIDKEAILKRVVSDLQGYKYCPFLDLQTIWNNFVCLPNEISLYDQNFIILKTQDGGVDVQSRWDHIHGYVDYKILKERFGPYLLSRR